MADFSNEKKLILAGYKLIAGVDEAGRGPLAGPVVAAAAILPAYELLFDKVDDSKKLSEKKRSELYDVITQNALEFSIQMLDHEVIDKINILNATLLAMQNAIKQLKHVPDYLLIDGNKFNNSDIPYTTITHGDSISKSIAAASILAKVNRDRWMIEVADKEFPEYNFAKHKGYGTKEHIELISKFGICKYHRKSFLTKILKTHLFDI